MCEGSDVGVSFACSLKPWSHSKVGFSYCSNANGIDFVVVGSKPFSLRNVLVRVETLVLLKPVMGDVNCVEKLF